MDLFQITEWVEQNLSSDVLNTEIQSLFAHHLSSTIGDRGVAPMLTVFSFPENGDDAMPITIIVMAIDDFNENRYAIMRDLGKKCILDKTYPAMTFLLSEAWIRTMSKEEAKAHRASKRQVADYDDKGEALVLMGRTIHGHYALGSALMHRNPDSVIQRYDAPVYQLAEASPGKASSDLLDAFWAGAQSEIMG